MPANLLQSIPIGLKYLSLLLLVPLISLAISSYLVRLEYNSQYAARQISAYLMQHNHQRQPRGALWHGILASRQIRDALSDSTAHPALASHAQHTPMPVLSNSYRLQHHGPNAAYLKVVRRPTPCETRKPAGRSMREVAAFTANLPTRVRSAATSRHFNRPAPHPRPDYRTDRP